MLKRLRHLDTLPTVEQRATLLSGKHITYTLKRSGKRRSIGLRVDDNGLTVSMPMRASEKWLHSVLQDKAGWVVDKLDGWQARKPEATIWQDGGTIDYLGELLVLRLSQSLFASQPERRGNQLWLFVANTSETAQVEEIVSRWYQKEALHLLKQRAAFFTPLLNVSPSVIKLSSAKSQWGSCTASGIVRLNVQLIKLPQRLIDYVVVHELAHLIELNHSASFWRIVESVCPDYAKLRSELKDISL